MKKVFGNSDTESDIENYINKLRKCKKENNESPTRPRTRKNEEKYVQGKN